MYELDGIHIPEGNGQFLEIVRHSEKAWGIAVYHAQPTSVDEF